MAEFRPTASQKLAIETGGSTVLVSAGAGSGKTRVLTERLMSRICHPSHPVDVDSFLIITYTRAAAAELRGRIMDELARRMAEEPENRRLRRQSALCSKARIGTIHSFCAALLREHSHLCALTPDFKVLEEERANSMKNNALERVLEKNYSQENNGAFLALADSVGAGRDDSRLVKLVLSLHSKMQCHARPDLWAAEQTAAMYREHDDVGETPWGREILDGLAELSAYWSGELERLMGLMLSQEKIAAAYLSSVADTAEQLRELERCTRLGWDRARACLPISFPRLGVLRNSPDPELSEMVKQRRNACKKAMEGVEKSLYAPSKPLLEQLASTAPVMEALLKLTLDFDREYSSQKRRAGYVDYSDLEHLTARLLTEEDGSPTELAIRLSGSYSEIMVDEYQDVSRVQDAIFKALSRDGKNLFFVGDVKQSIYRFRLADPGIFTEKYLSFADADSARGSEPRRIMLQENFRSRKEILNCANAVFSMCMSRSLGELDYDEDARLKQGASYEDDVPKPELMLLELEGGGDEEEQSPDKTALEAAMVGRKIRSLMASGILVGGRPLDYGDICILMRAANSVGGIYRRELSAMGIPVASGQSGDFFTSLEVSVMLSMLAVVDNPHQDIPLISVLRSPSFGFDADELSAIRACDKEGDFYTALCKAAEKRENCADFVRKLERLRRMAPDMSAAQLLWQLINEMDMLAICSAMADGPARRENLMELVELSERYEATGYRGLHRFVLWLRQLAAKNQYGSKGSGISGVQIMTVHKSKGLEFPVVFLSDTARRFNRQDSQEVVLVHPQLGLGPKVTDHEKHIEYPSLARNAIRLRTERETLSEEMRLLYVALTRPREYLYMTGTVKDAEKLLTKSAAAVTVPMQPQVLSDASAPLNWLVYAALADGEKNLKIKVYRDGEDIELPCSAPTPAAAAAEDVQQLEEKLSFRYPHQLAQSLPSKLTATELKGRRERDGDAAETVKEHRTYFRMPELSGEKIAATAARRGIATHLALQYMDFEKTDSLESIKKEVARLREEKYITAREASLVDSGTVEKLFASELGQRMRRADKVHREFKFSVLVDGGEFFPGAEGEKLLLQGVVDCCLEEDGKLIIIDYKTDNVKTQEQIRQRSRLYASQLKVYALALSRIFGMEVSECLLYFLSAGKMLKITEKDLQ